MYPTLRWMAVLAALALGCDDGGSSSTADARSTDASFEVALQHADHRFDLVALAIGVVIETLSHETSVMT